MMDDCTECDREFPDHLLNPLFTGRGTFYMCPLCALKTRNRMHNLPSDTLFQGEVANDMWIEANEFIQSQEVKKCSNLS